MDDNSNVNTVMVKINGIMIIMRDLHLDLSLISIFLHYLSLPWNFIWRKVMYSSQFTISFLHSQLFSFICINFSYSFELPSPFVLNSLILFGFYTLLHQPLSFFPSSTTPGSTPYFSSPNLICGKGEGGREQKGIRKQDLRIPSD